MADPKEAPTATASIEVRRIKAAARAKLFGESGAPPQISRYRVLRQLGVGGMGEVFLAHDDGLGRKIAIKLVRLDRESAVERASSRLLREAQALARLSHPNVVQVYEVGQFEGRVFIAMEFVHGVHMRRWLEAGARTWRQILDLYLQAGQGLAAAHRVGLVHRDFKPENVLVGDDGRVRVVDFGLVRKAPDGDPQAELDEKASAEDLERSSRLTQSGALMGTPSYMSPEQFQGLKATDKSDQFAFCVALYRGLYGWHPFAAETRLEMKRRVLSGQLAAPPRDAKVPAGIFEVLERGMQVDPERRYPSMEALLAALAAPPRRRRVGLVASTAAAALAGGLVAWFSWPAGSSPGPAPAPADWGEARRKAITEAFAGTGVPYGLPAADHALDRLDRRVAELQAALADLEAAPLPDTRLAARQAACLARRARHLEALVEAFTLADVALVERAADLVEALPPLAACDDLEALAAGPRPTEPTAVAATREAEQALESARILALRRRWDEAARKGELAAELALRAAAGPQHAEARAIVGRASLERGAQVRGADQLLEALVLAQESRHDELVADLWLDLAEAARRRDAAPEPGLAYARLAAAAAARVQDPQREARAAQLRATLLAREPDAREAETTLLAALDLAADSPALAARLALELARLRLAHGRPEEARPQLGRAREFLRAFPGHPLLAAVEAELDACARARRP